MRVCLKTADQPQINSRSEKLLSSD